ncbi:hypothetical protein E5S67_00989 [Microcoleus sp. IPMA8]|uniref:Uncharacterized protein n=1 Tax=Microcoleus asticus IPMA8 TaxID=2563858 RepID=A0ABX2CSB5_9CYAN|nr:hypothetical protein [Microcoleus asticus IPMA8]
MPSNAAKSASLRSWLRYLLMYSIYQVCGVTVHINNNMRKFHFTLPIGLTPKAVILFFSIIFKQIYSSFILQPTFEFIFLRDLR